MKEYFNDITRENLELIKMYKSKLVEVKSQIEANKIKIEKLRNRLQELLEPLRVAQSQ